MFQRESCEAASSSGLLKLVEEIGNLCPPIELPWLECDSYLRELKADLVQEQEQEQELCSSENDNIHLNDPVDCKRTDPINTITEQLQEPKDYSHLYIYKNPHNISSNKPTDYISLPSSSDEDNYSDDDDDDVTVKTQEVTVVSSTKKVNKHLKRRVDYQPANVGLQQANLAKKLKKH